MKTPNTEPNRDKGEGRFDSIGTEIVFVEGDGDTTIRPIRDYMLPQAIATAKKYGITPPTQRPPGNP